MARLGDICDILNGFAFKSEQYVDDGIRIIRIANVQKGYVEDSTPVFYPIDSKEAEKYRLEEDDILMSLTGNVGRVAKLSKEFLPAALNQRVACLRIKAGDALDKAFLFNLLNSDYFEQQCIAASKGVAQKNMSTEWLKEYEIPMFSLEQQKAIASVLDKVTELIALRKEQLAKLDQLVKSRFIELMDSAELSEEVTVEQITERVKVGFVGTCEKYYTDASGIPMLRTGNITDHGIDMSDLKYVTVEFHDKNRKSQIRSGDLLIARHGSNGQANVYDGPEAQCLNAVVIVPNQAVAKSVFLAGLINSPKVKEQIDRTLVGSTQHVVNTKSIAHLVVRIPCLEVQEQYEAFVEQTDKSKFTIQQSLDKLETLKKSLMQEYFG